MSSRKSVTKKVAKKSAKRGVQAKALGDNLLKLLNVLKVLDISKITQIAALGAAIAATTDLKTRIRLSLQLAGVAATMTPTTADDALIASANSLLTDPVLDMLVVILGKMIGPSAQSKSVRSIKASSFKGLDVSASGLNLSTLLKIAKWLAPLILSFV